MNLEITGMDKYIGEKKVFIFLFVTSANISWDILNARHSRTRSRMKLYMGKKTILPHCLGRAMTLSINPAGKIVMTNVTDDDYTFS